MYHIQLFLEEPYHRIRMHSIQDTYIHSCIILIQINRPLCWVTLKHETC